MKEEELFGSPETGSPLAITLIEAVSVVLSCCVAVGAGMLAWFAVITGLIQW